MVGSGLVTRFIRISIITAAFVLAGAPASAQLLNEAVWFKRNVGAGVTWHYYHFSSLFSARQSVSYVEVDLANPSVNLKINYREAWVGPSPGLSSPDYPRQLTSVMAREIPGARAAINGTYFNTASYSSANPSAPWGGGTTFLRVNAANVHTFDDANINSSGMGILFNSKNDLSIRRKTIPWINTTASWQNMMVCGPVLLTNGVVETYASNNTHANARHPRSAVGKTAGNKLILLTVDGRTDESAGMSCTELARVMQALGCVDAINLDGGGSTTLWANGEPFNGVVNYPSDNGAFDHQGERRAANALVVTSANPTPLPYDARLTGLTYNNLTRSGEILPVTVNYTNIGSQTWTAANVKMVPSRRFGRVSPFIPLDQASTFATMTPSTVAPGQTAKFTLNLTAPAVSFDRNYTEHFALWHTANGYFGPADHEVKVNATVRPALTGAPPMILVQGTPTGPNNQWYVEGTAGWGNSSVSFTADGVNNSGTQRYCVADVTNRYADFKPIFDVRGVYKVEAAFPYSGNSIDNVRYTITHMNGSSQVFLSQLGTSLANTWHNLGNFSFSEGAAGNLGIHFVRVSNGTTLGNRFYSGAVRFDFVGPLASINDWTLY